MGSLNFVSPDAGFVFTTILKNPTLVVDDLMKSMSTVAEQPLTVNDLASAFGGEVTIALDGPLLPVPALKFVAEVYDPGRIQTAFSKLVTDFNTSHGDHQRTGNLSITESAADSQTYYTLKFDKLPWEADWTFVDGYWVAATSHELVARAIQNRQTGYTLPKSAAFQQRLLHDGSTNFSAVVYHNMGQTLTPLLGLLDGLNMKTPDALKQADTGGLVAFWAGPDRIDMAMKGTLFGMDVPALLAMQATGPLSMMKATVIRK
jgi:hypothetical protein